MQTTPQISTLDPKIFAAVSQCLRMYSINCKLKTRMLEHVIRPPRQGTNTRLWTNNNCESMNHRFKISTDWKPQRLLELVNTIHDIVRLHFADLKRTLFGQEHYELECAFQHLYVPHTYGPTKQQQKKKRTET